MDEKIEKIINTSLEILEIHAEVLLKKTNENTKNLNNMENNLRILIEIGCALHKLQRLKLEQNQPYQTH
ncbi:hypothetical protein DSECCO2_488710 [anaerobic digester metagenome]